MWTLGRQEPRHAARPASGKSGAALGVHLVEDGWTLPERAARVHRVGHLRADVPRRVAGRTRTARRTSSSATATRPRRRRCRRPACRRPSTWTSPWRSTRRSSSCRMADEYRLMRLDPTRPTFAADLGRLFGEARPPARRGRVLPAPPARDDRRQPAARQARRARRRLLPREELARAGGHRLHRARSLHGPAGRDEASRTTPMQVTTQLAAQAGGASPIRFVFRFLESLRADPADLQPAARALHRRRGLPRTRGQDLRLGTHPQRAADPVPRRRSSTTDHRIRVHFDRIDDEVMPPRASSASSGRSSSGTSGTTRCGSRWLEIA